MGGCGSKEKNAEAKLRAQENYRRLSPGQVNDPNATPGDGQAQTSSANRNDNPRIIYIQRQNPETTTRVVPVNYQYAQPTYVQGYPYGGSPYPYGSPYYGSGYGYSPYDPGLSLGLGLGLMGGFGYHDHCYNDFW